MRGKKAIGKEPWRHDGMKCFSTPNFLKAAQAHNSNAKDGMERWGITCQATNSKPKPKGFSCCCSLEDNIKIA